jgi:hypothetical protein
MPMGGLAGTFLLMEAAVFFAVGIREVATRSWVGAILAWGLGFLALLNAWAIGPRRSRPESLDNASQ